MNVYRKPFLLIFFFTTCTLVGVFAQGMSTKSGEQFVVHIDVNDEDGVFYKDQEVQCFVEIKNTSEKQAELNIEWSIATDDWQPLMLQTLPVQIEGKGILKAYCPWFQYPGAGFFRISARIIDKEDVYPVSMVVGIDPEELKPPMTPPVDMDDFWKKSIAGLKEVQPAFKITPVEREGKTNLFEVEMQSVDGLTVRGWLEVPKKKGNYPALLRVPGYQENLKPLDKYDDMIVFSFNTRDHGESDDSGVRSYDMWVRGMESRERYFYRGIFLDCIRAMDYLESRPDVDMSRIAIWGGSQGGGLSFAVSALDARISLCIADIPYMCDYPRYFAITHWNEVDNWFAEHPDHTWQLMYRTLSYYDTKYMAKNIKCQVIMGIGLQDDVCPPSTSFMTYNLINAKKEYSVYKTEKHSQPASHYESRFLKIRKIFGMD